MAKITVQQLTNVGACKPAVEMFLKLFGTEVELTKELALQHYDNFDIYWAGQVFFGVADWEDIYDPLKRAYDEKMAPVTEQFCEEIDAAHTKYQIDHHYEAFASRRDVAHRNYDRASGTARIELDQAIALAFVEAYNARYS